MAPWIYCLPVHWPFSYWVACVFMTIIWGTYISNIFLVYPLLFICRLIISFKFIDGYMTFEFWGFLWRPSHAKTNENAFPPLIYWFLQINLLEMKYLLYLNFFFMLLARWPDCCRYSSYWLKCRFEHEWTFHVHLLGVPWTNTCDTLLSSHLTTEPSALTLLVGRVLCENAMRNFVLPGEDFYIHINFYFYILFLVCF